MDAKKEILDAIVEKIPAPEGDSSKPLQALIFDSYFDSYRGVIVSVKVDAGKIKIKDRIRLMATGATYEVVELGVNTPKEKKLNELTSGQVGWINASIKSIDDVHVGDTITLDNDPADEALHGYKPMKPMVYSGIFPIEPNKFESLREALEKL